MFDVSCIYFGILFGLLAVICAIYALVYFVKIVSFFMAKDDKNEKDLKQ